MILLSEVEEDKGLGRNAIVYDWTKKELCFGGAGINEMEMREIVRLFFGLLEFCRINPMITARTGDIRRNWKIVFKSKCLHYEFKIGYKKLMEARVRGGIKFIEVDNIGRIFN